VAVDRGGITVVGDGASAIRVQFVEVMPGPHDGQEGLEVVATFGVTSVIGCRIAGDDVRAKSGTCIQWTCGVFDDSRSDGSEVLPSVQISRLVVLCWTIVGRAEVRVVRSQILASRTRPMAAVTVRLRVNDEAAQSHQFRVLARHIDEVRRNA
jgi:hypothetical protein